ncbi:MAG: PIN domain-containing protein [Chthoniobacterales bacterium]
MFLSNIILVETVCVLRRLYNWKKEEEVSAFETLLEIANFVFEDEAAVSHATWAYLLQGDWADHLIQAKSKKHHCTSLLTFDKKFSKFYPDFVKLLS